MTPTAVHPAPRAVAISISESPTYQHPSGDTPASSSRRKAPAGIGFPWNVVALAEYTAKEVGADTVDARNEGGIDNHPRDRVGFIGMNEHGNTGNDQIADELNDTGKRGGFHDGTVEVDPPELRRDRRDDRVIRSIVHREGTSDQLRQTPPDATAILVAARQFVPAPREGAVHRVGDIFQGVEKRTVQVEYDRRWGE